MIADIHKKISDLFYAFPGATEQELTDAKAKGIPDFIIESYRVFNGCYIGIEEEGYGEIAPNGKEYKLKLLSLSEIQSVRDCGYIDDDTPYYEFSKDWWQIVHDGNSNYYAIDATEEGKGRILDIPHEEVGYEECHAIIADSYTDLLEKIIKYNADDWFGVEQWKEIGYI